MKIWDLSISKMMLILILVVFSSASNAGEKAPERMFVTKREALARGCKLGFKDAPIGATCITTEVPSWFSKEDELVELYGEFKKVEINLANGDVVRATEMVGTRLIFEDALLDVTISTLDAIKHCESKGLKLPTGYPEYLNGKDGFPNEDSDLQSAQKRYFQDAFLVDNIESDMKTRNPGYYGYDIYVLSSSFTPDIRQGAFQLHFSGMRDKLIFAMYYNVAHPGSVVRCVKYK